MGKFNEYSQKATPEDADFLIRKITIQATESSVSAKLIK